ncbi:MAG TPA: ADP-ribosylglycohydrolase family protein, partial [Blastocatellia bacterium]|nr:ADP-ribosylglycohydrolase family protein [Blastocatellia bacterium]
MAGCDDLASLLRQELIQRAEEGCDVSGFQEAVAAAGTDAARAALYDQLMALPVRPDFPYIEPSELAEIRAERPDGPRRLRATLTDAKWQDRFRGAWLGRCAGCALGKPLEAWPFMSGAAGNPGWKNIQLWFAGADAWPITGYTPGRSRAKETLGIDLAPGCRESERENIRFMQTDDDLRYTVLGLLLLEQKGRDFDSWDIGKHWHRWLTYSQVWTAETQAYLNFAQVTSHMKGGKPEDWQIKKQWVRTHRNPYREWIGAQIRADAWAYGAAGHPELAAEFAWRDASFSHVKNGIYGEMFMAAVIAAAFVEPDVEKIIEIGLSEIPRNCRLARDIRKAVEIARDATDQTQLVSRVWETFQHYHPVHTNNNAALATAALVFARDDYEKAITTAVLGGWDTDCNGATTGSIMGARLGAAALPEKWTAPLNDTLYAEIPGFHPIAISE